jgi:hypothetical protein
MIGESHTWFIASLDAELRDGDSHSLGPWLQLESNSVSSNLWRQVDVQSVWAVGMLQWLQ